MSGSRIASARLYGFIDTAYLGDRDPAETARLLIDGGVDVLQVRAKDLAHPQRVELCAAVLGAAFRFGVPVIVNDDIAAAFETGADGVHLGQEDWAAIPPGERKERLAAIRIVGISTHSLEQALAAERDGADYIGVGPVFPTATKPGMAPVGLDLVRQVSERVAVPFFAIGGINLDNLDQVLDAGARRVAVVSAILRAEDPRGAAQALKERLNERTLLENG
jgi:thiamine-phosphate pyrophosphorylase